MSPRYAARLRGGRQCIASALHTQQVFRSFTAATWLLDEKTTISADKPHETKQHDVPRRDQASSRNDKHNGQAENSMLSDHDIANAAHELRVTQILQMRRMGEVEKEHKRHLEEVTKLVMESNKRSIQNVEKLIKDASKLSPGLRAFIRRSTRQGRATARRVRDISGSAEMISVFLGMLAPLLWVVFGVSFGMWFFFGDWPSGAGFSLMEVAKAKRDAAKAKEETFKVKKELTKLGQAVCDATTKEEIMRLHTTAESFEEGRWSDWLLGTATITSGTVLLLWALLRKSS